jgi:hypothetical protein
MSDVQIQADHDQAPELSRSPGVLDLKSQTAEPSEANASSMPDNTFVQRRKPIAAARQSRTSGSVLDLLTLARQVGVWGALFGILSVILALPTERLMADFASHQGTDQHQTLALAFFSISLTIGLAPSFLAGHFATRRQGNARLGSLAGAWCSLLAALLLTVARIYGPVKADQDISSHTGALLLLQGAIGLALGALGGKYTRWQRIWKKRQQTVHTAASISVRPTPAPSKPALLQSGLRSRWQRVLAWWKRSDVRTALGVTLGLWLGCSVIALFASSIRPGAFFLVGEVPLRSIEHLLGNPPPLTFGGLLDYFSRPWKRWDAGWYTFIAVHGYGYYGTTAFLPAYPYTMRWLAMLLGGHYLAAGLLISIISCFGCLLCLYRLIERFSMVPAAARWALIVAVFLPVSFFLVAVYTESLFLWVSLGAMLAFLNRQWGRMAALTALASLIRNQGLLLSILLVPTLISALWGWLAGTGIISGWHNMARMLYGPLLAALAGPAVYLGWVIVEGFFWHLPLPWVPLGSTNGWNLHFTIPGVGIVANLMALAHPSVPSELGLPALALDTGAALLAVIAILVSIRRLPLAFTLYAIATWCLALAKVQVSDQTMSTSRYLLPMLLLVILPAEWLAQSRPLWRLGWILAGIISLFFFTWYFLIGAWVA